MQFLKERWRYVVEILLLLVSIFLVYSYSTLFDVPEGASLYILLSFALYFVLQFFLKLGLTLPFIFIVAFMIFAIQEWNTHQARESFDLEDYQLAIAFVVNALNGALIYFENKLRW